MLRSEPIIRWQVKATEYWHQLSDGAEPLASLEMLGFGRPDELMRSVMVNHDLNFRLWHEEDQARDPTASDSVIAGVKRRIDVLNQQRNDAIEAIDLGIERDLADYGIHPQMGAVSTTETAGAAIDRLSILVLRAYHYQERLAKVDSSGPLAARISSALETCRHQRDRLAAALDQVLAAIYDGTCRHEVFRQLKMYNDPELNPLLKQLAPRDRGP